MGQVEQAHDCSSRQAYALLLHYRCTDTTQLLQGRQAAKMISNGTLLFPSLPFCLLFFFSFLSFPFLFVWFLFFSFLFFFFLSFLFLRHRNAQGVGPRQDWSEACQPSDVVLTLVQLPVVLLGGAGVCPDASIQGEVALQAAPVPGQGLHLLLMPYSCCCPSGPLACTQHPCQTQY